MKAILLAAGVMMVPLCASGQNFYSGNDLLDLCERGRVGAISYVSGAADAIMFLANSNGQPEFCLPEGTTDRQITDVVCKHIDSFPSSRHRPAAGLTRGALNLAFPCAN